MERDNEFDDRLRTVEAGLGRVATELHTFRDVLKERLADHSGAIRELETGIGLHGGLIATVKYHEEAVQAIKTLSKDFHSFKTKLIYGVIILSFTLGLKIVEVIGLTDRLRLLFR